ncbi:hypothetical protein Dimus_024393 [Dionaea muscipula]
MALPQHGISQDVNPIVLQQAQKCKLQSTAHVEKLPKKSKVQEDDEEQNDMQFDLKEPMHQQHVPAADATTTSIGTTDITPTTVVPTDVAAIVVDVAATSIAATDAASTTVVPTDVAPTIVVRSGENRRRDDDEAAPEEEAEDEDEGNQDDFDWEAVIDEATVEGESGSGEKFYDAEEEAQGSPELPDEIPAEATPSSAQQKDKGIAGVDPSGPTSREAEFLKFQAEFERKRANRFHDDLEKAKAENAKLLALLHQAQTKPHP